MVRRATLDRGLRPDERAAVGESGPGIPAAAGPARRPATQWRGAGGRWLVWAFRAVVWAVLLIIGYRGVVAIAARPQQSAPVNVTSAGGSPDGFPAQLAAAYAMQFGEVYLNFSPATAAERANQLAAYLPAGATDPQLGWNGAGTQQLQSEQVASIDVRNAHNAVVTLLAQVNDKLIELGVPIYSASGGLSVAGEPALVQGPAGAAPPAAQSGPTDSATQAQLLNQLRAFFRAYGSGDQVTLGRFLAPGASITGLGNAVSFGSITGIDVPVGGAVRHVTISVEWRTVASPAVPAKSPTVGSAPAGLEMTYQLTVIRQGGTWYVKAIGPSTQQLGPP
jgi:Conjugative transposon protein TcpC